MTKITNKNKKFLSIIFTTIFAITTFATFSQISFATESSAPVTPASPETPAKPTPATKPSISGLKDLKYDVNKELKLPGSTTITDDNQPKTYFTDTKNPPIISFLLKLINYATTIIGTIAMIIFIIAGFMFMIAQGDQTKIDKAKEIFKYAIYGLIITFLSYLIVIFVQSLFITQTLSQT